MAKTVLLIDDEDAMRRVVERRLATSGYVVLTAGAGAEGMRLAQERRPDVILLDAMMPRLSGLEICRQLKQTPQTKSIPVILLTANVSELLCQQAVAAGASICLHKPFEPSRLLSAIDQCLSQAQAAG